MARTDLVALAVVGAALGMADDDESRAGVLELFGGNVAGMGAGRLGVAILAADGDSPGGGRAPRPAIRVAGGQISTSAPPISRRGRGNGRDFRQ